MTYPSPEHRSLNQALSVHPPSPARGCLHGPWTTRLSCPCWSAWTWASVSLCPLGLTCVPTTSAWVQSILAPGPLIQSSGVPEPWCPKDSSPSLSLPPYSYLGGAWHPSFSSLPSMSPHLVSSQATLFLQLHWWRNVTLLSTCCSFIHVLNAFRAPLCTPHFTDHWGSN